MSTFCEHCGMPNATPEHPELLRVCPSREHSPRSPWVFPSCEALTLHLRLSHGGRETDVCCLPNPALVEYQRRRAREQGGA